ncbi:hypothetical protein N7456_001665 [Penicillium angulare]|uniref:Zn(2)-C6 fungal-type domain-containing protein n=1 Tax=Penicillium angulare TaxID=116970 RepID=A0A9W9KPJ3_9EURO|nr:hypothetical protein N7456_001665 [Penicillium angulare]
MSEGNRQEIACGTKRKREATVTKKRTSLACDTCRKQKEKCEGGQPCWRCQRLDRQCQFSTPQATRRPSHSPREDLSLCHSPKQSNRHQKNLEQIVQHFLGDVDLNEENIARVAATCEAKSKEVENSLDVAEEPFDVHFVSKDVACSFDSATPSNTSNMN